MAALNASGAFLPAEATCGHCHESFAPRRHWQRFCSASCRRAQSRGATRQMVLTGMIETAKQMGMNRNDFLAMLMTLWTD